MVLSRCLTAESMFLPPYRGFLIDLIYVEEGYDGTVGEKLSFVEQRRREALRNSASNSRKNCC